jgi:hypothetical protein
MVIINIGKFPLFGSLFNPFLAIFNRTGIQLLTTISDLENNKSLYLKIFVYILLPLVVLANRTARAQQVDSIFFHLYTDSLKKGVHNYINVDGKMSDGRWQPLTAKELNFTSSAGRFENCNLIIDSSFKGEKVTVKATLKNNPLIWKEVTIYMKTRESVEKLKTIEEVMNGGTQPGRRRRRG